MSLFNVLWFVFFGWFNAFLVLILSGFMAITIIGLPIAKSLLQFAKFSMFPFGKEVVRDKKLKNKPNAFLVSIIANIIWLPAGLFLTLVYFLLGVIMISTIVGIRIGIVYLKMGKFILKPIGTRIIFQKKPASASNVLNEIEKKEKLNAALKVINI